MKKCSVRPSEKFVNIKRPGKMSLQSATEYLFLFQLSLLFLLSLSPFRTFSPSFL